MSTGPHDLAGWLRGQSDDALARLLTLRPDLLHPVPPDVSVLAARATGRASVEIALDRLDVGALDVLDAITALPEPHDLASALAAVLAAGSGVTASTGVTGGSEIDPADVIAVVSRLRDAALIWGPDDALRMASATREILARGNPWSASSPLGPSAAVLLAELPAGQLVAILDDLVELPGVLSPRRDTDTVGKIAHIFADPAQLRAVLATVPAAAREVLELLAAGPPVGRVPAARRAVAAAAADTPVRWLLAHGLIVAVDDTTVVLPREVAVQLRGGHQPLALKPPDLDITAVALSHVDAPAAGQAFAVVRLVETLLESWGIDPPGVLRAGGLGVRDLRRTARELDLDESMSALLIETVHAAGLIGPDVETAEVWLPTLSYDLWLARSVAQRWAILASAWLTTTRASGLIGRKEQAADGGRAGTAPNALGPDADRALAPIVRRDLLRLLADLPPGSAPSRESVTDRVRWSSPRRGGQLRDDLVGWTLIEAEQLGITGRGALSSFGLAIAGLVLDPPADDGEVDQAANAVGILEPLLPKPLDHILLQADLTAIAPGPLESSFARELALAADVESTGGATVYRFSESSIRRALDSGRSAADLHALFAKRSRTPVPQPLSYLVDDVARRHGRIRIGVAGAYIRCDDVAVLAELLADRRAQSLRLHRLAPSVLVSPLAPERVAERIREMGYAPAAENPDGALLLRRPDARRSSNRPHPARRRPEFASPVPAVIMVAVRAIRGGDRAVTAIRQTSTGVPASGVLPRSASRDTIALLQAALEDGSQLWIGYLNQQGQASNRIVEPIRLAGGYLTAFDHRHDETRTFAIHRITGVAQLEDAPPTDDVEATRSS